MRILILDQGRQSLPFLKSFAQGGNEVIAICNNKINEVYFSRYPSKKLIWPSYFKEKDKFEQYLINYLKSNDIDITISVSDISSEILSRNKTEISKYTKITSPDYQIFSIATDKLRLMDYCQNHDIPCPKSYPLNEINLESVVKKIDFPLIIKPRKGLGAIGVIRYDSERKLRNDLKSLIENYGELLIQEYIPSYDGMQYQAEAFLDENSLMKVCLVIEKPRYFPVEGGTSTANVTINHPEIYKTTKKLLEGLKWKGAADVDFILDTKDGIIKVLEINPRVTAGIKIGFVAGIDFADLHLKLALGKQIPEINDYKIGIYCRNILMDLLWFLFSSRLMRKNTKPSYYKFFGKNVCYQTLSYDDPFTFFGFLLHMLKKYSNISYLKNKLRKSSS